MIFSVRMPQLSCALIISQKYAHTGVWPRRVYFLLGHTAYGTVWVPLHSWLYASIIYWIEFSMYADCQYRITETKFDLWNMQLISKVKTKILICTVWYKFAIFKLCTQDSIFEKTPLCDILYQNRKWKIIWKKWQKI